jgi:hypothetical protein
LLDTVLPRSLNPLIVGATANELVVVRRRRGGLEPHRGPEYSLAITVVPGGRGIRIETVDAPGWVGVSHLRLAPSAATFLATDGDGTAAAIQTSLNPSLVPNPPLP